MIGSKSQTLPQVFLKARLRPVTQVAFRRSDGKSWKDISWPEYFSIAESIACGLASLGISRGQKVAIMSSTRAEWAFTDLANLGLGLITVPIYQSSTPEDVEFILENSETVAVFVEDEGQLSKLRSVKDKLSKLKYIFSFKHLNDPDVIFLNDLQSQGTNFLKTNSSFFEQECQKATPEDMATIVYTSGTTGVPKGAILTHENINSECSEIMTILDVTEQDSTLTFLPFAHIFGRVEMWTHCYIGFTMGFAESIDRIGPNLLEIKPTFMMAVPRIFEKLYSRIISQVDSGSQAKKKLFYWALDLGKQVSKAKREGQDIPFTTLVQFNLASKLVFSKIYDKLGGRIRYLVSGGAPLSREIAEFFHSAGVLILEGYGLTETTAAITVNTPYRYKFGTVGLPVGEVKLKIAEDGEVLVKSKKVFKGYNKSPDETQESLKDGWFYTGDIGEIDNEGFLKITDRKKDLLKTAGGKMIAPQKIENLLKTNKYVSQAVVFGDKMKYLVALITLNMDEASKFATAHGIAFASTKDLANNPQVIELIHDVIREKNSVLGSYETIKNFAILDSDFTVESGELTPSLKVKRKLLSQKYADLIKSLYTNK